MMPFWLKTCALKFVVSALRAPPSCVVCSDVVFSQGGYIAKFHGFLEYYTVYTTRNTVRYMQRGVSKLECSVITSTCERLCNHRPFQAYKNEVYLLPTVLD